jgi:hypothetical protein
MIGNDEYECSGADGTFFRTTAGDLELSHVSPTETSDPKGLSVRGPVEKFAWFRVHQLLALQ